MHNRFAKRVAKEISKMELRTSKMEQDRKIASKIQSKLMRIERDIREGNVHGDLDALKKKLSAVKKKYKSNDMDLEEVKDEVDEIYGDQSDNSTYYFTRENNEEDRDMEASKSGSWYDYGNRTSSKTEENWYDKKK
jgi:ParB-like chromosome segregation protein Spo0J